MKTLRVANIFASVQYNQDVLIEAFRRSTARDASGAPVGGMETIAIVTVPMSHRPAVAILLLDGFLPPQQLNNLAQQLNVENK